MHLSLAFPGIDQRDTPGKTPGPCGNFEKHLPCRVRTLDWFLKRTRQTRDASTGFVCHWSALRHFQSPG